VNSSNNCLHYKNYIGSVEFSEEDAVFHGKVIGIKPLISFEGYSVNAIVEDFRNAVDEYLDYCLQTGIQPEKPLNMPLEDTRRQAVNV
jgi:predicted HicB family RNase H-like nuclease